MQHMRRFSHKGKALQVARPNWSELPDSSARVEKGNSRTAQKSSKSSLESWLDPHVCDSSLRVEAPAATPVKRDPCRLEI